MTDPCVREKSGMSTPLSGGFYNVDGHLFALDVGGPLIQYESVGKTLAHGFYLHDLRRPL